MNQVKIFLKNLNQPLQQCFFNLFLLPAHYEVVSVGQIFGSTLGNFPSRRRHTKNKKLQKPLAIWNILEVFEFFAHHFLEVLAEN